MRPSCVIKVAADPAASTEQKLAAYEIIGLSYLILGDERSARRAFEQLLAIDPGHVLRDDSGSPKIRDFYAGAKQRIHARSRSLVELQHHAPATAVAGQGTEIAVSFPAGSGAAAVKELILFSRKAGDQRYQPVPMRATNDGQWRGQLVPPAARNGYVLEYYIEGRDLVGQPIARAGSPEAPLRLSIERRDSSPAARSTPWYRRWYVIAGGVAVAGASSALLLSSGNSDGTLGRTTLTP